MAGIVHFLLQVAASVLGILVGAWLACKGDLVMSETRKRNRINAGSKDCTNTDRNRKT